MIGVIVFVSMASVCFCSILFHFLFVIAPQTLHAFNTTTQEKDSIKYLPMEAVGRQQNQQSRGIANRKRKAAASPPTTVELRGINIHFPFKPYKCQEDYMGKVLDALLQRQGALLESPTGTGKTLCLLCACLAWQREQAKLLQNDSVSLLPKQPKREDTNSLLNPQNSSTKRVPTIVYASRTHSQLSQVVRELRNTRYRPKHAVLGSREQMCVHPKVKKETATSADINHDCNALAKERKCRFRNQLEGFTAPNNGENTQAVLDMEDLVSMGKEHKVCPFYYTRSLLPEAELVLMPYNYLFDKDARETTLQDIVWKNAVVIFDEAHNLENFATDSASFDLTQLDIAACLGELNRAINYIQMSGDADGHVVKLDNILRIKTLFLQFEEYFNDFNRSGSFAGEFMMDFFTKGMLINYANHNLFLDQVRKVSELLLDARGGASGKGAPKLEHFNQCVKRVFGEKSEGRCLAKAKSYRVHITPKNNGGQAQNENGARNNNKVAARTLSYWCFAPALAMQELSNLDIRSIIVTSGTLSPLPSYSMELGIPFAHTLENPHIISSDQIHVRVIGKGVSGKQLNSSYQRRQDVDYYIELGNTLVSLAKVIPGGMLIFFPSYGVMQECVERWGGPASSSSRYNAQKNGAANRNQFFAARKGRTKNTNSQQYSFPYTAPSIYGSNLAIGSSNNTIWKRLLGTKSIVVEPKSSSDLPDAISEFRRYLNMTKSKGCCLMGVCRGKISEGIDFADNMSRAVVITGLPFPPAFDPKVKLKREFLDSARASKGRKSTEEGGFGSVASAVSITNTLSGHEWYSQQAHRAVNQAIGRVIRNRHDYGAVLLLDSRYEQPVNHQGLSKWLRPHLQPDQGVGTAIRSLAQFYKQAEAKAKEREQASKGIVLEYEPEEEEEELKRKSKQQQQQPKEEEEAFTKIAFIQNLTRDLKKAKASLKSANEAYVGDTEMADRDGIDDPLSYIAPEQVIARVDVGSMVRKREPVFLDPARQDQYNTSKAVGLDSVFKASKERGKLKGPLVTSTGPKSSGDSNPDKASMNAFYEGRPSANKTVAAHFFKKAKSVLSNEDFSTIRKCVVALKRHGDKKDTRAFLETAQEVVATCSRHEHYFGPKHESQQQETLLFMFFRLVPAIFRRDVELRAMRSLYANSTLGQLCKENLAPPQHDQALSLVPKFLHSLWCVGKADSSGGGLTVDRASYLREAETIISFIQEANHSATSRMVDAFMQFAPSQYITSTHALLAELKANDNIRRIKASEAARKGEGSIDMTRFSKMPTLSSRSTNRVAVKMEGATSEVKMGSNRPPAHRNATNQQPEKKLAAPVVTKANKSGSASAVSKPANWSQQTSRQPAPGAASASASKKSTPKANSSESSRPTAAGNPYSKNARLATSLSSYISKAASWGDSESAQGPSEPAGVVKSAPIKGAPPAYCRTSQLAKLVVKPRASKTSSKERSQPKDAVSKMLREAESESYIKKSNGDFVRNLQSNAPSNLSCTICSERATKPMLSECNHLACESCWLQWLKKSGTCPTCRVRVEKQSLARAVFQNHEGNSSSPPSLSQLL
jgi:regulator of telomere elongation helicase 1